MSGALLQAVGRVCYIHPQHARELLRELWLGAATHFVAQFIEGNDALELTAEELELAEDEVERAYLSVGAKQWRGYLRRPASVSRGQRKTLGDANVLSLQRR